MAVVLGQQAEQQLRKLDHRRVSGVEEHVVVRQLLQLTGRRRGQILAPVAEVGAPQTGHAIEVTIAVVVPQVQAVATDDHARPFFVQRLLIEERVNVVGGIGRLIVLGFALGFVIGCHFLFS
ncbi:hypothetical protein D3C81_252990 [compost metagenome]